MRFDYHTRYRDGMALMTSPLERGLYGALLAGLILLPFWASNYWLGEIAYVFILCIAALGLMVLIGFTGQVSLGHAAFVAIGAYAHVWLMRQGVPMAASIPLAALMAAAAGLMVGLPAIRVSGLYLAMVTLAFAIITEQVIGLWRGVTGGFIGLSVPRPELFGLALHRPAPFYWFCLAVLVLVLLGLLNVMRGPVGRAFVGVRDSEAAALGLGINVNAVKAGAFALSAGVTGLAGALMAHHLGYLTPDGFTLLLSLELVLMVVIGGLGSLRGAILGAILIAALPVAISRIKLFLPDAIARQFGLEIFVFGLVLAVFVLFEPRGLNGRWLKIRALLENFPLYRRDTFRRQKAYMKSERYR